MSTLTLVVWSMALGAIAAVVLARLADCIARPGAAQLRALGYRVSVFLLVLLLNTWVAMPDAVRVLRRLAVTLGSALVFKFVILDGLAAPATSRTARVLAALFDVATLGTVTQPARPASAGYLAFLAVVLFLAGVSLWPRQRPAGTELIRR